MARSECKKIITKNFLILKKQNYKSLGLSVGTAVGLLVGMILFIPALAAVCRAVPLIGASIVIATCICIAYIFLKKAIIKPPGSPVQKKWNYQSY